MYVCLCVGATSQTVSDAVAAGASTSKEVAAACGAGARLRTLPAHAAGDHRGRRASCKPTGPLADQVPPTGR